MKAQTMPASPWIQAALPDTWDELTNHITAQQPVAVADYPVAVIKPRYASLILTALFLVAALCLAAAAQAPSLNSSASGALSGNSHQTLLDTAPSSPPETYTAP